MLRFCPFGKDRKRFSSKHYLNLIVNGWHFTFVFSEKFIDTCLVWRNFFGMNVTSFIIRRLHDQSCDIYFKFVTFYFSKDFPYKPNVWHFWTNLRHLISQTNSCKNANLWHLWHFYSAKISPIYTGLILSQKKVPNVTHLAYKGNPLRNKMSQIWYKCHKFGHVEIALILAE